MSVTLLKNATLAVTLVLGLAACKQERPNTALDSTPVAQAATPVSINAGAIKLRATVSPEEVILIDNGQQRTMQYLTPQMRTAVRAMGFGGVGQYAVLRGKRATLRLAGKQPLFVFAIPSNAQPESYFTLASFAVRDNGTREVIVGGGYMSYSTGVHQDRIVPTSSQKLPDQSKAPKGYVLYAVAPEVAMKDGEYAMIFYNSQVRGIGFASTLDSYFDFGVGN
ncbi:hypothetical protein [Azospirillum doebereinerae]|uniref:Uncharacterized protein n=1 Tax=Azospirillum doebereinerae TaxID=92933 RepID=A0A3S0WYE6_9PROT|nr:hypothetical protein [Azospirillum doebereinerae]RUQ75899.1 hypothetical protein EJ913_01950 [Azospirillum doebereinerae]